MLKSKHWILAGGLAFASAAIGQISPEQAGETLKARLQAHKIAATQPASREDLDEAWTEIHNLRAEVNELHGQMLTLQKWGQARDAADNPIPSNSKSRNGTARPARAGVTPPANNGSD